MSSTNLKDKKKKAENIIISEINKNADKVTTVSKNPAAKYEAPDNLEPDSTILED